MLTLQLSADLKGRAVSAARDCRQSLSEWVRDCIEMRLVVHDGAAISAEISANPEEAAAVRKGQAQAEAGEVVWYDQAAADDLPPPVPSAECAHERTVWTGYQRVCEHCRQTV